MIDMDDIIKYDKSEDEDYYSMLHCDSSSTTEQIQVEYRILALQHHPDKNAEDPEAEKKFQKLQTAKTTLCDPEKRAKYDKWRSSGMCMSYEQWCGMTCQMTPTMHWAEPKTKDRMVDFKGASASNASNSKAEPLQQRRASEVIRVNRPTEGWERDSSDVLKKFRNYEI